MKLIYASDIHSFQHCRKKFWLERNPPPGTLEIAEDPFLSMQKDLGLRHEQAILSELAHGRVMMEPKSVEETCHLMESGVDLIYQGQLMDEERGLFGKPDFLIRSEDGSYRAGDAKLARSLKDKTGIQLAFYRNLLGTNQGASVFLGNGSVEEVGGEYDEILENFIRDARKIIDAPNPPTASYSVSKCNQCVFHDYCRSGFEQTEDISLLYGVHGKSVPALHSLGIRTIGDLAKTNPQDLPDLPYLKGEARKHRAIAQAKSFQTGNVYLLKDIHLPKGTYVHFDIESNPLNEAGMDHVYLWGLLKPDYSHGDYEWIWSDSLQDDQEAFLKFLDLVGVYYHRWPDLKLIHFSPFERSQIRNYSRRYGLMENPLVKWLLDPHNGPLFDIKKPVMDSLVLPLNRYGLKDICKHPELVNFQWENEGSGSQWSIVQFLKFESQKDPSRREFLKREILTYNRDDVLATRKLEEWLRSLKEIATTP